MTVPTAVAKHNCLDFALSGTSVPLMGNILGQNNTVVGSSHRDLTSGKSIQSFDLNANTILPQLSLTNSANTMLLHRNEEVYLPVDHVPQFYINADKRGSSKILADGTDITKRILKADKFHNKELKTVAEVVSNELTEAEETYVKSSEKCLTERKSLSQGKEGNDINVGLVCRNPGSYIGSDYGGENRILRSGGSDRTCSQSTESACSESVEEETEKYNVTKKKKKHRQHIRRATMGNIKVHKNKQHQYATKNCPVLVPPQSSKSCLDFCAETQAASPELNHDENGTKLGTLPKVFINKGHHSISESKSYSVGSLKTQTEHNMPVKITKVFLSDRQSGTLKESGSEFPCAPPATPIPDPFLKYEYIASMADIRAQRTVKVRLEALEKLEQKKKEQIHSEKLKREKQNEKEREREIKQQQRLEIYALNKVMADFEWKNFEKFCKTNGIKS